MRFFLGPGSFMRSRWFAPTLHILLFAITWLLDLAQSQPLLDGPARFGFAVLFITDFPISLVAFSALWEGKLVYALLLWGILGTVWWYFAGIWICRQWASTGGSRRQHDAQR
jgi:hypothetical protein